MGRNSYADRYVLPREDTMTVVPVNSRGMKDPNPEVRAATSRAMLAERYAHTPKFRAKCAYPPCNRIIEGYDRNGKRRKFCSPTHNTADCRRRQRELGYRRVTINGEVRLLHVDEIPPMINGQPIPGWPPLPEPRPRVVRRRRPKIVPEVRVIQRVPRSWQPVGSSR
jgi:hypothetical protein